MSTGRRGRPPKPVELKVLEGNPGKRPLPDAPLPPKPERIPPYPRSLARNGPGRRAWRLYWHYGRAWLAHTDRPLVERLCRLIDRAEELERVLTDEGFTRRSDVEGAHSSIHNLFNNLLGIYSRIERLEASAGFTPVDRNRIQGVTEGLDELDAWQSRSSG